MNITNLATTSTVHAPVFNRPPLADQKFTLTIIHERELYTNTEPLDAFLRSASSLSAPFGLAGAYVPCKEDSLRDGTACLLTKIAVATPHQVLVIALHFPDESNPSDIVDHTVLYNTLFNDENPLAFVGFDVDRLALQLFGEYGMYINNAVDIFSIRVKGMDDPRGAKYFLATYKGDLDIRLTTNILNNENDTPENDSNLATRAWVGAVLDQASEGLSLSLAAATPINLSLLRPDELIELKKTLLSSDRLRGSAAEFQQHDVEIKEIGGNYFAVSQQFNTRVRRTDYTLELTFNNEVVVQATVGKVMGRTAALKLSQSVNPDEVGDIVTAFTLGKEEATTLDNQRSNFILFALQGKISISNNPLLCQIWFPKDGPSTVDPVAPELKGEHIERLNNSQREAVEEMLKEGPEARIVLIHGPPGTGKTSVIAAMTQCLISESEETVAEAAISSPSEPRQLRMDTVQYLRYQDGSESEDEGAVDAATGPVVWIVAQSNVAVKNVAEKLVKVGILQFKLIVSKEFHFEWHEHVYTKVKENMVITSDLPKNPGEVRTWLHDARVILCTLSILTSPLLSRIDFYKYMPVNNVVVDEASQIQLGDLLPLLHLHASDIKRLCLVGDHKQLAPYGQEEVSEIESIFEKDHIVEKARFLKITYRLPKPISNIISSEVYNSKLIPFSEETRSTCCKWFDIPGQDEPEGHSYCNALEIEACILMARQLEAKGHQDYRIISPYAVQSNKILARLKEEKMPWEDKCFNVDSFQGNEADYIIVSLVRTQAMGFLQNNRRANVLLTRCKKGMFIMTCRELMMRDRTRETLLGKFAFTWDASQKNRSWPTYDDLVNGLDMVDKDLTPASNTNTSPPSKAAARKAARAEKSSGSSGTGKPTQPKGKGKKR